MKLQNDFLATQLSSLQYRPDIDGLRAIAILSVVFFHAFPGSVRGGFIGVDVFFVISGFLISTIIFKGLNQGAFSFGTFYARRIKRIFPSLIIVMVSCYAFGWLSLFGSEYQQLGWHIFGGSTFLSNFILWDEIGYFDAAAETKPLLHLWSLAIEEQFYIVFPLLAWLLWKRGFNFSVVICCAVLVSFFLSLKGTKEDASAVFYMPHTRFWELLSGCLLASVSIQRHDLLAKVLKGGDKWLDFLFRRRWQFDACFEDVLSWLGLLLLVYGFWRIDKGSSFPGTWALIPIFGAVFIIAAGPKAWVNRRLLSNKVFIWFGLISFPLYLWHWPLLSFATIIETGTPSKEIRSAAVVVSILLAWVTYRFVEKPIRMGSVFDEKTKAVGLTFVLFCVGSLGYVTEQYNGIPSRASIRGFTDNQSELLRSVSVDKDCLSYWDKEGTPPQYCRIKNVGGSRVVAVVGDSHAHVAFPGIANTLKDSGINTVLLANGSCPSFTGLSYGSTKSAEERCREQTEGIVDFLVSHEEISDVFLFSRGTIYVTGTEPLFGTKDVMNGRHMTIDAYKRGMQNTIDALVNSGKRVFYVLENPELATDPRACITRPFKREIRDCALDLTSVLSRQKNYRSAIFQLENVTVLDSLPVFCSGDVCSAFNEAGELLYADDDHLSVAGSELQAATLLARYF